MTEITTTTEKKKSGFISKLKFRRTRKTKRDDRKKQNERKTPMEATSLLTATETELINSPMNSSVSGCIVEAAKKASSPAPLKEEKKENTKNAVAEGILKAAKLQQQPRIPQPKKPVSQESTKLIKSSWLTRTKAFRGMCDWAFNVVDLDESGCVDEKELYSGLLLIHLKLGTYTGPAACKPVDRARVHDIFVKRDIDNSGSLDKEEFQGVMAVLCGNIFTRVLVQWSSTIIIVPMVARILLDELVWLVGFVWDHALELKEFEPLGEDIVLACRVNEVTEQFLELLPEFVWKVGDKMKSVLDMIPDSVWETIPVTLISCVLGCLVVPYIIFKIDDFFQSLADGKKHNKN